MKKLLLGFGLTLLAITIIGCGKNYVTKEDLKNNDWIAETDGDEANMIMSFSDHVITIGIDTSSLDSTATNDWEKLGEDFASAFAEQIKYTVEYTLEKNELKMQDLEDEDATTYYTLEKDGENIVFTPAKDMDDGEATKFILKPYEKPEKTSSSSIATSITSETETISTESDTDTIESISEVVRASSTQQSSSAVYEYSEPENNMETNNNNNIAPSQASEKTVTAPSQSAVPKEEYTTVLKGETPEQIATRVGISVDQLFQLNGIDPNNYMLYPGDTLRVK